MLCDIQTQPTMTRLLLVLLLALACFTQGSAKVITSCDWHHAHPRPAAVRAARDLEEGVTIHVDQVSSKGRAKGSYRFVSALNKPEGPQGLHAEDLWRQGKWASFEPLHGARVRVATAEPHSVREGDVLHLDMFTAAHVRKRSEEHTSELQSLMRNSY